MKHRAIFPPILPLLAILLAVGAHRSSGAGASTQETADYQRSTLDFVNLLATGRYEDAYSHLDSTMARISPPSRLERQWKALESQAGPFANLGASSDTLIGDKHVVDLTTRFEWKTILVRVAWDAKGAVSGMRFLPVPGAKDQVAPPASPAREMEIPLHIGPGQGTDPEIPTATVSFPPIDGKKIPAVILVSKRDRNSLAAVAQGFQSHGIGVLRWQQGIDEEEWAAECVPAIRYLQNRIEVDQRRIFVVLESSMQTKSEKKNPEIAGFMAIPDLRIDDNEVAKLAGWILGGNPKP